MSQIDWKASQHLLGVKVDGDPGPITYGAILQLVGHACQEVADALAKHAAEYGMTTPARLAEFIAQIANETGGFIRWEENLHYSAEKLCQQWPAHFNAGSAQECVGHPEKIAERAYGGRMGNGPCGCGDGWKFRGRGALQLTGRDAYRKFGGAIGIDLVDNPDLAAEPGISTLIALKFFQERNVNAAVDEGDFVEARQLTNGGSIGLEHVAELRARILAKVI